MLTLTRKVGEGIVIGDNIKAYVTLIDAKHNRIRLAFDAPRDVVTMREELLPPDHSQVTKETHP